MFKDTLEEQRCVQTAINHCFSEVVCAWNKEVENKKKSIKDNQKNNMIKINKNNND